MPRRGFRSWLLPTLPALTALAVGFLFPVASWGDGTWIENPPPSGRYGHTAIRDPVRDRMVVFGGIHDTYLDDTWSLTLGGVPTWIDIPGGTPPSPRSHHTAIYDPVNDRMVVFGGYPGTNDVWELACEDTGGAWSPIVASGTPPSARYGHTAIYDPVRQRMVMFGGYDGALRNDVWTLSLQDPENPVWSTLDPTGTPPPVRGVHTAIYDPVRDRMLIFGGGGDPASRNDVWALSLGDNPAWSQLSVGGSPSPRQWHTAIYDPANDRMVIFGGAQVFSNGTYSLRNDVWVLSFAGGPAWSQISVVGPSRCLSSTAIHDPLRDRMLVFGGDDGGTSDEVFALALVGSPTWSRIDSEVPRPIGRINHTAIYDPDGARMIVFGGYFAFNDVWELSLLGDPAWSVLSPAGPLPAGRSNHSAIHDPVRDQMVLFGGDSGFGEYLNDVWTLSLAGSAAWNPVSPGGSPPSGRFDHTAIYDPVRDRMVVFGGWDGALRNDTWALSLSGNPAWSLMNPLGEPPSARRGHTTIYDPARDRMVVFGGWDGTSYRNDVWALALFGTPAWSELKPSGGPPSARGNHSAIYDPVRDRMVVFGGHEASERNDVWALFFSDSSSWSELDPEGSAPTARASHSAIYDPMRDRMMVVFGGSRMNDVHALQWGPPVIVSVPDAPHRSNSHTRVLPNPASGSVAFEVHLDVTRRFRALSVYNVRGQLAWRVELRDLPAGVHRVSWNGRTHDGRRAPSGVYLARLEGGPVGTCRFVLLD